VKAPNIKKWLTLPNILKVIGLGRKVVDLAGRPDTSKTEKITEAVGLSESELGIDWIDQEKVALLTARIASLETELKAARAALRDVVLDLSQRYR
jgi:hypothetical protein